MSEFIDMNVFGKKEKILEMRMHGEVLPYFKNHQLLIIDHLDGYLTIQISKKDLKTDETKESLIMEVESEDFVREIKDFLHLKENERN